jgi:hypothetical protein
MRPFALALLLFLPASVEPASQPVVRVEYVGGTRADIPSKNSGGIGVSDSVYFVFASKQTQVKIPYDRINLLEYGQHVSRRYLEAVIISPLFMLAKKRQHFLTVGFEDADGNQQAMVFRVDKSDIRLTLVALEARTGRQITFQDEEARISGKG